MTSYPPPLMLIGGEWTKGSSSDPLEVLNPASGESLGRLPRAGAEDLDRALASTRRGFEAWSSTLP